MSTTVKFIFEGGLFSSFELVTNCSDTDTILDGIVDFASNDQVSDFSHLLFRQIRLPVLEKNFLLVTVCASNHSEAGLESLLSVYCIKCAENETLSLDKVTQSLKREFDVEIPGDLVVYHVNGGHEADAYPCGTLFTSGSNSARSYPSSSYLSPSPPHYRPDHLSLFDGKPSASPDSQKFGLARSVVNSEGAMDAMIAGNSSYNMSNNVELDLEADEDSALNNQLRNGPMVVPALLHETLPPMHKPKGGEAGGTLLLGNIDLETPSKGQLYEEFLPPKILVTEQENQSPLTISKVPSVETHSQETEQKLSTPHSQHERASSQTDSQIKASMVVGIEPQRRLSVTSLSGQIRPVFARHTSLPGEKHEKSTNLPTRNASDTCLKALADQVSKKDPASSPQDVPVVVSPNQLLPCNLPIRSSSSYLSSGMESPHHVRTGSETLLTKSNLTVQETRPVSPGGNSHPAPVIRGYTPTSPTKPLAVQRQESVAAEFVAPKNNFDARSDLVRVQQNGYKLPQLTEKLSQLTCPSDEEEEPLCMKPTGSVMTCESSEDVTCESGDGVTCEGGDGVTCESGEDVTCDRGEDVTCESCESGQDVICEGGSFGGYPGSRNSSILMSGNPMIQQQVHMLEHALNGTCFMKDECKNAKLANLEFTQGVEQMRSVVEEARNGLLEDVHMEQLKEYILEHCQRCTDRTCKIPHRMAGCLPPGQCNLSSGSEQTDSFFSPQKHREMAILSFDQEPAFLSTSSDVRNHQAANRDCPTIDQRPHVTPPNHLSFAKQGVDDRVEGTDLGTPSPLQGSQDQTAPFSPLPLRRPFGTPVHRLCQNLGNNCLPSPLLTRKLESPDLAQSDQRFNVASPMGSGGFNVCMAPPVRGHHYQESQMGSEQGMYGTNMRQVSDNGRSEQKPTERRQYCFPEPSKKGNSLRKQLYGGAERRFASAKRGDFPNFGVYAKAQPGTMIYSIKDMQDVGVLIPGELYPYPQDMSNLPRRDKLGEGGNGTVVKYPLNNREFALKHTHYRINELNTWSDLFHENILPLQGVMIGETFASSTFEPCRGFCYQFMPKMTDNLRHMMKQAGDLCTLLQSEDEHKRTVIMSNVLYILEGIVNGLNYLHSLNIQHSDLKASNVLILKKCQCQDIFHCECPIEHKYEVRIADFDSVKKTKFPRNATQLPNISGVPKTDDMMKKVMGTPAYRAPEQFKHVNSCKEQGMFKKIMQDGQDFYDMEGPWCDLWSLGVIILQIVLGPHSTEEYINQAGQLICYPTKNKMEPRIEASVAILRQNKLLRLAREHPELDKLVSVTEACLEIDFRKRKRAEEILKILKQ